MFCRPFSYPSCDPISCPFSGFLRVFGAMVFSAFSLGQAASLAPDIPKAQRAAGRIFQLLDEVPPIDSYSEEGDKLVGLLAVHSV